VEGCYHGHHDSVQVSVYPELDEVGPRERPVGVPGSSGIPAAITDLVVVVPYNDLDALERALDEHRGEIAGMIMEPVMMNAGIILPRPGYLEGVRELTSRHGALLAFDEVKTGLTAGPGGVTARSGVTPDIVCLAKAVGGGLSTAAIGGSEAVMDHITRGDYEQVGTFNGNPLALAAARAALYEVLTPATYARLDHLRGLMADGCARVVEATGLAAHTVTIGAKGCVTFSATPVDDFRAFAAIDDRYSHLHWLYQHNGGVFLPPWGKAEQWLLSAQHGEADVAPFLANFEAFATALTGAAG
jgi:glutamate-1-semialdehyde 2,1-aminomutase